MPSTTTPRRSTKSMASSPCWTTRGTSSFRSQR
jgi:hypothetical protein